ncbi:hypothetical protein PIIN_06739 [Serendipita indica DSM 11827]|uniref:Transcription initiation factor TFIID subunit 13 n=1 Tax=Serendipita indica (strain DSM 11827) TaxID=1109443 RepID=G4TNB0_SERID|nr:hypothetical protein PIIN_06739 [Serendipita indica DSM 11827]
MRQQGGSWPQFYPNAALAAQATANYLAMRQGQGPASSKAAGGQVEDISQDNRSASDARLGKKPPPTLKGLFTKDLKEIMYGLGDEAPAADTVALMDDILVEYLHDLITTAGQGGKTIQTEDLRRTLQGPGDERKLARLEELIVLQIEIKKARAINGLETAGRNLGE